MDLHSKPKHVVIRQRVCGDTVREILYGRRVGDRKCRSFWAVEIVGQFPGEGYMLYSELLNLARAFVAERGTEVAPWGRERDRALLNAFLGYVWAWVRANQRITRKIERWKSGAVAKGRIWDQVRQDLLDGHCPHCGAELPCSHHGIQKMEVDGRGGLRQTTDVSSCSSPVPSVASPARATSTRSLLFRS